MTAGRKYDNAELPDSWRMVRLGDVVEVNPRRPSLDFPPEGAVTFLPMASITENLGGINEKEVRAFREVTKGYTYFEENDVLFAKITPCLQNGKHALATGLEGQFGFGTTEFHVVRAGPAVDHRFLFKALTRPANIEKCVRSFSGTAGQQRVQPEVLRDLRVFLPPLPEQRAIADVLDSIDEAIERTEAVIAATETLRDSLIHELLIRGVPGWHTEWKDVPGIGIIPADWKVVRLGEVIADGPTNGIYKPESDYGDGSPIIRIDDFISGSLVNHDRLRRVRVEPQESQRYAVSEGEILINRVNSMSHIGKTVLMPAVDKVTLFESNMMKLKLSDCVQPKFGEIVLLSSFARRHFVARAKKAVQQASINQQDVAALVIPLPPLTEQGVIVGIRESLRNQIEMHRIEYGALEVAKRTLTEWLLTGRVRIGD